MNQIVLELLILEIQTLSSALIDLLSVSTEEPGFNGCDLLPVSP